MPSMAIIIVLVIEGLGGLCDLATSSLMQPPHLATHCLPSYKPTELPVLHCVKLCFFPFLFSWPFFQHPKLGPQKRAAERTTDRSKVGAIVSQPPPVQETALHSPLNISPTKQ